MYSLTNSFDLFITSSLLFFVSFLFPRFLFSFHPLSFSIFIYHHSLNLCRSSTLLVYVSLPLSQYLFMSLSFSCCLFLSLLLPPIQFLFPLSLASSLLVIQVNQLVIVFKLAILIFILVSLIFILFMCI
jgi:hypothetical protein